MIAYALGKWWWLKTLICQQPLAVRPRCKAAYNQQRAVNQLKLSARNRDNWFHKKVPSVVTFSRFISVFRAEFRPDESGGGLFVLIIFTPSPSSLRWRPLFAAA